MGDSLTTPARNRLHAALTVAEAVGGLPGERIRGENAATSPVGVILCRGRQACACVARIERSRSSMTVTHTERRRAIHLCVFLFSLLACWLYAKSASVWPAVAAHAANNLLAAMLVSSQLR
jgi:hypothetical protein